jgi:3-oxoacyl-[acyl-carrier protein] reductase
MSSRAILITGANGGLGSAIARSFLNESKENLVWLGVRQRRERAQELSKAFAPQCQCVDLDVTDAAAWRNALKGIGRVDVLINNAGAHEDALLAQMPVESWQRVLSANLDAVFHGCQAVLPQMIAQRSGRIINIASLSALLAPAGQTNYAAAKAGVVALTQSLAKEVARLGITVNAICPGYVETDALNSIPQEQRAAAVARIPMRRFGRPEEIAAAVRFLACPEASYITGSVLKIDGGIL